MLGVLKKGVNGLLVFGVWAQVERKTRPNRVPRMRRILCQKGVVRMRWENISLLDEPIESKLVLSKAETKVLKRAYDLLSKIKNKLEETYGEDKAEKIPSCEPWIYAESWFRCAIDDLRVDGIKFPLKDNKNLVFIPKRVRLGFEMRELPFNQKQFIEVTGYIEGGDTLDACVFCDYSRDKEFIEKGCSIVKLVCAFYHHQSFEVSSIGCCRKFRG